MTLKKKYQKPKIKIVALKNAASLLQSSFDVIIIP